MFSLFRVFMAEKKPGFTGESERKADCSGEGTEMLWSERLPKGPSGELECFLGRAKLDELCEGLSKKPVCLKGCWPRALRRAASTESCGRSWKVVDGRTGTGSW